MIRRHQNVLIFGRGGAALALGWIMAAMVYLSVLASIGALLAHTVAERWSLSLARVITVQVPSAGEAGESDHSTTRLGRVLDILRDTPGVERSTVFDARRTRALLDPWLGGNLVSELPLPVLIDVRLVNQSTANIDLLRQELNREVPGTEVEDHRTWLQRVVQLTTLIELGGLLIVALMVTVALISIGFAVVAGLTANRMTIEVLHLIGASDSFVANRLQWHVLGVVLPASIVGGGLATATLILAEFLAAETMFGFSTAGVFDVLAMAEYMTAQDVLGEPVMVAGLDLPRWTAIPAVVFGFVLIAVIATRTTALVMLRRSE